MEPEELKRVVQEAHSAGLAVAIHALGDRANREVIGAIAAARGSQVHALLAEERPAGADKRPASPLTARRERGNPSRPVPALPHRIEHAQLLHPRDFQLLAQHGIVASMQPVHCTSDRDMADLHWGEPRCAGAYGWRSMLDAGVKLAFGSDAPVESLDVLRGIHAAITRERAAGSGESTSWHPEQCVSVTEAVHAYTAGAAAAAGEEPWRGSITPGKLADLVVLSRDIFRCPPEDIISTQVDLTYFGGQLVHGA
jgi:predicted amidohydrolase YtcJ